MPDTPRFTVQEICEKVQGQLTGPGDLVITGLGGIEQAQPDQLTLLGSKNFVAAWQSSKASAAIVGGDVDADLQPGDGRAFIRVKDADLAMITLLNLFAPPPAQAGLNDGVHPTAIVDPTATLGSNVRIGAHTVVGPRASIGDNAVIHANVMIYDDVKIGAGSTLWPHVVVRERCTLGRLCIVHSNATIGADGFGFRPAPDGKGLLKIPQIGTVEIGDDVEIGASTCIDRGKFGATVIGSGCKIDNLCQIGHNCKLGRCVILVSQVGLSGSVTVEDGAILAGKVGVADHVTIHAGAKVGALSGVMADVPAGKTYIGLPAMEGRQFFRLQALMRKLPDLTRQWKNAAGDSSE